jgi:hypothetical protein
MAIPTLPNVSKQYDPENEAQMRAQITQALTAVSTAVAPFPLITSIVPFFKPDSSVQMTVVANTASASIKVAVSTSAFPSAADVEVTVAANGTSVVFDFPGPYSFGTTVYISAFSYSGLGGTGARSSLFTTQITRATGFPALEVVITNTATTNLVDSFTVTIVDSTGTLSGAVAVTVNETGHGTITNDTLSLPLANFSATIGVTYHFHDTKNTNGFLGNDQVSFTATLAGASTGYGVWFAGSANQTSLSVIIQAVSTANTDATFTMTVVDPTGLLSGTAAVALTQLGLIALQNVTLGIPAANFTATLGTPYTFDATLNGAFQGAGNVTFTATRSDALEGFGQWFAPAASLGGLYFEFLQTAVTPTTMSFTATLLDPTGQLTLVNTTVSWLGLTSLHDDTHSIAVPNTGLLTGYTVGVPVTYTATVGAPFQGGGSIKFVSAADATHAAAVATWVISAAALGALHFDLEQVTATSNTVTFSVTLLDPTIQLTTETVSVSWNGIGSLFDNDASVSVPSSGYSYTATIGNTRSFTATLSGPFSTTGAVKFVSGGDSTHAAATATWFASNAELGVLAFEFSQISSTATTVTFTAQLLDPTSQLSTMGCTVSWNGLDALHDDTHSSSVVPTGSAITFTFGIPVQFTATLSDAFQGGGFAKFVSGSDATHSAAFGTWYTAQADQQATPTLAIVIGNNQSSTDQTAKASMVVNTPDNIASIKWLASISSYPTQAAVASGGTSVTGGSPFSVSDLGVILNLGDTVFVTIITIDTHAVVTGLFYREQATRESLSATKTAIYSVGSLLRFNSVVASGDTAVYSPTNDYIQSVGSASQPTIPAYQIFFTADLALPKAATILTLSGDLYLNGFTANAASSVLLYVAAPGTDIFAAGPVASVTAANTAAFSAPNASLSTNTTGNRIMAGISLIVGINISGADDARFRSFSITYLPANTQATV